MLILKDEGGVFVSARSAPTAALQNEPLSLFSPCYAGAAAFGGSSGDDDESKAMNAALRANNQVSRDALFFVQRKANESEKHKLL